MVVPIFRSGSLLLGQGCREEGLEDSQNSSASLEDWGVQGSCGVLKGAEGEADRIARSRGQWLWSMTNLDLHPGPTPSQLGEGGRLLTVSTPQWPWLLNGDENSHTNLSAMLLDLNEVIDIPHPSKRGLPEGSKTAARKV